MAYILAATVAGIATAADRLSHRGKVIDAETGKPLPNVVITAYATKDRVENKRCPKYKDQLDDKESASDGAFVLSIPSERPSYVATYCAPAYEVFTKETNKNELGASVEPTPVRLWRINGGAAEMATAITLIRNDTRKAIASLSSASPAGFVSTLSSLPEPERALVTEWMSSVQQSATVLAPTPEQSLGQVVNALRTTLEYFEKASPDGFRAGIKKYAELEQYMSKVNAPASKPAVVESVRAAAPKVVLPEYRGRDAGAEFLVRIFFHGAMALVPTGEGRELTVLLLSPASDEGQAKPLLLAQASACEGDCSMPAAVANSVFPLKTQVQAASALEGALLGGGAWLLKRSDLTVQDTGEKLGSVRNVRRVDTNGNLALVPTTPSEREDFSWVADLRKIDPAFDGVDAVTLSDKPPPSIAARLRIRNGKVFTYALMPFNGKVKPLQFIPVAGRDPASAYSQAVASWVAAEVRVPGDSFSIVEQNFDNPTSKRTMRLHPQDGVVEIVILNVVESFGADHCLDVYYDLMTFPPPREKRFKPVPSRSSLLQADWISIHPTEALWSNLLGRIGLAPPRERIGLPLAESSDERIPCPMVTQ